MKFLQRDDVISKYDFRRCSEILKHDSRVSVYFFSVLCFFVGFVVFCFVVGSAIDAETRRAAELFNIQWGKMRRRYLATDCA